MKTSVAAASLLWLSVGPLVYGHRLDEYLQATTIELEQHRIQGEIRLTPGVAVYTFVKASIDADNDGAISSEEQKAYAQRVLRDLSLKVDGKSLSLQLISMSFPATGDMKEGLGEIRMEFRADGLADIADHTLVFENRHQRRISAYLVNCLVPHDPNLRVTGQSRNVDQSVYQLKYKQGGVRARAVSAIWLAPLAMLLFARLVISRRPRRLRADVE